MGFAIEDKHFIKWLWVKSIEQKACLRCFVTHDGVLVGQKHWLEKIIAMAALTHVHMVVDHTLPAQRQI